MIQSNNLDVLWAGLTYTGNSEFEYTRIDNGDSIPEISLGFNSKQNRCLLLELPKVHNVDFQTSVKQNLTMSFFSDTGYIVLELTDSNYTDLFNDLVISIYQRIYKLTAVDEYSKIFIQMFYKWSEFFDDRKSEKLSQDIIKGLFGELFVLKTLIEECNSSHLNDLLHSWKGPYDKGHDFELDQKNIEVKTKEVSKLSVKISSEYQLEAEADKALELLVLSVETNSEEGQSLRVLLTDLKDMIINKMGDVSIVLEALSQKNITAQNIYQYDNYRFEVIEEVAYDCNNLKFPKLTKSNTPKAIGGIQYTLYLSYLNEFIISTKKYHD